MNFRKKVFRGTEYIYWVGPTHTRVSLKKGVYETFLNHVIGNPVEGDGFRVTFQNIENALMKCFPPVFVCRKHKYRTARLIRNPTSPVIRGEQALMINCPKCLTGNR